MIQKKKQQFLAHTLENRPLRGPDMALTRQTLSFIYYKYVQRTQGFMKMMSQQIESINKNIQITKKEPNKILEFKSIISKMKTLLKLEI